MKSPHSIAHQSIYLLLSLITVIAYFPLYKNGFISFDDHTYIYRNEILQKGISWEGVRYAFSFQNQTSYWHPLTWLSLMLDYQLWGLNPVGYHLENLCIHIVNGFLLYKILFNATSKQLPSCAVALIFLVHPTAVESVAWAVERKTVLSTLFFLLTLLLYLRYEKLPSLNSYMKIVVCMALGLMAKSMIVTLPFIMLLFDLRPLGRLNLKSDGGPVSVISLPLIIEKIPLCILSCISITLSLFSHPGSAKSHQLPLIDRLVHAIISYCDHLLLLFLPSSHAVYYPIPHGHQVINIAFSILLLLAISITAIMFRNRYPWFILGWLWYIITFAPVSGLIRAGKWPGMADRFLYIPAIGITIAVCFTVSSCTGKSVHTKKLIFAGLCAIIMFFTYSSNHQVRVWRDSVSLFTHTVNATPESSYAHYLLGGALYLEKKDHRTAEIHFLNAIKLDPYAPYYKADLGEIYLSWDKPQKALPLLQEAVQILFDDPEVLNSLASALLETNKSAEALKITDRIIEIKPAYKNSYFNRGIALYKLGRFSEAKATFTQLLALTPENIDARINLGMTLIELKDYDTAIAETQKVLLLSQNDSNAHVNLGIAYEKKKQNMEAIIHYQKALSLKPDFAEALKAIQRLNSK